MRPSPKTVETTIERAEHLLSRGQVDQALATIQPIVLAFPRDARANLVAARAYRKLGQSELALARYKTAAEASHHIGPWREFVTELLRAGQKGRARKAAAKAPVKGPEKKALLQLVKEGLKSGQAGTGGAPEAALSEIKSLVESGRLDDASRKASDLVESHPGSAFLHNVLGIVALARGNHADAEAKFRQTLEISPNFSGAYGNLGLALMSQRKLEEAISILGHAVIDNPRSLEVRTNLAVACLQTGQLEDAVTHAEEALKLAPDDTDALYCLGAALNKLKRYETASRPLERLLVVQPDHPDVLSQIMTALDGSGRLEDAFAFAEAHQAQSAQLARRLGELLAQLGRLDEAAEQLRGVIDRDPNDANAFYSYGGLRKWSADDPVLERLRLVAGKEDAVADKGLGFYALAKAQTDLGEDDHVMQTLGKANRAHAASTSRVYDPEQMDAEVADLIQRWRGDVVAELAQSGAQSVRPVFVVGMPRSGSTLLDQILCAHRELTGVGEDSVVSSLFPVDIKAKKSAIADAARNGTAALRAASRGGSHVVDKFLFNFLRVGSLAAAFPRARFLRTVRDPRSIALSIYSNPLKVDGHPYSTALEHIGRFFLSYERMMDHWQSELGDRVRSVNYETLVTDPEAEIRDLIAWLGLDWDEACLKPNAVARRVKTLSVTQVRGEISTSSVEKWRRFEDGLQPFTDVLVKAGRL